MWMSTIKVFNNHKNILFCFNFLYFPLQLNFKFLTADMNEDKGCISPVSRSKIQAGVSVMRVFLLQWCHREEEENQAWRRWGHRHDELHCHQETMMKMGPITFWEPDKDKTASQSYLQSLCPWKFQPSVCQHKHIVYYECANLLSVSPPELNIGDCF